MVGIVFIMRGIPGSGKSTRAREIAGSTGVIHSTDDFFYGEDGEYKYNSFLLEENHRKNFLRFRESLREGIPVVIVDNTNLKKRDYFPYLTEATKFGYGVRIIRMPHPEPVVAASRNIHGITEPIINAMISRFEE